VRPELITSFDPVEVDGHGAKAVELIFVMVRAKPGRAA
jgi:hydroxyquinol 1,2-dioxygenase